MEEHGMPTIETGREINGLLQELSEYLNDIKNAKLFVQYYWEISKRVEKLIEAALGKEGMKLPIDVMALADKMGIDIMEEDLNEFSRNQRPNKTIGQIDIRKSVVSGKRRCTIYIDENVAPVSKRYAIAHELIHNIIHFNADDYYEDYCSMPMCPVHLEEYVADVCAIFLMIPVKLFFQEFTRYIKQKAKDEKTPIATEYWIKYLAERSGLPEYYVAYGYQQLRYVAYWIYQAWEDDDKWAEEVKMTDPDRKKIIDDTKEYFTTEIVELLFE